jgi:erythromycin esterase
VRAYNQEVPAGERVRFVGFDIQYNDEARRIVLGYLRRVAPERVAPTESLFQVPVDSLVYVPYLTRDTAAARVAAEVAASAFGSYRELHEFVRANDERFATRLSMAEAEHLATHARVLDQFADVYGRLLAGPEEFNHLLRDRYMAENFRRMLDAQPPDARVAVWAHNLHLMADSSLWSPRPMGRYLRKTYGSAYYALALGLGEGTFMAWCPSVLPRPSRSAGHRRRRGVAERAAGDVRRHIGLQPGMGRDSLVLPDEPGDAVRWGGVLPDHDGRAAPAAWRLSGPDLPVIRS